MTLVGLIGSALSDDLSQENRGLEMGLFGFGKKKKKGPEFDESKRNFLKAMGVGAAGIALSPLSALAGGMKPSPKWVEESEYPYVIQFFYEQYNIGGFEGSTKLLQKSLSCRTSWSQQNHLDQAFANEPAMAYLAELFNKKHFDGDLSFGHSGDRRYGDYRQREMLEGDNITMLKCIWTIIRYFKRYSYDQNYKLDRVINKAYETLSYAFYDDKGYIDSIKKKIESGEPIPIRLQNPNERSHQLAALWAAGMLSRTYYREGMDKEGDNVKSLVEKPMEKIVGYGLGNLPF